MGRELTTGVLSSLRVAVARADRENALRIYDEIDKKGDRRLTVRACIQMAFLGDQATVEGASRSKDEVWLLRAKSLIEDWRSMQRDWDLDGDEVPAGIEGLEEARRDFFGVQLQLARAWQRFGRGIEARSAYETLLRELTARRERASFESHILAIAEYRLAELRFDEAPSEACERWRRVVEMRDEEISPYAALRMATQIGSPHLVGQRVERLFHYAMGTSDPRLYTEAALGLARHLKERNEFREARRFLKAASEIEDCPELSTRGVEELERMDRYEDLVRARKQMRRPKQLQAKAQRGIGSSPGSTKRVVIVGAGKGGSYLLESLNSNRYTVCGFVDDYATELPENPDHPILGRIDDLESVIRDLSPHEVLLAIPTLSGERRRQVVHACRKTRTPLQNLPGVHELGVGWTRKRSSSSLMNQLRRVKVGETLGAERRALDTLATGWLQYKIVLVIGAGAIGSEICRRLADAEIASLVVVDKRESALKKIETELRDMREFWAIKVRLGDATEPGFLAEVFEETTPHIVFNATGDASAIAFDEDRLASDPRGWKSLFDNEVRAAWEAARAAGDVKVPQMVHISSRRADRVADPLGALKLLCEELVLWQGLAYAQTIHTVVRLGPLLDSLNGPFATMEKQIRAGAGVTIPSGTPSAAFVPTARCAELVLHAGRLAEGGELFEPLAGVRFSPAGVAREAVELADLYADDVVIEETEKECWNEPFSPLEGDCRGDAKLEMKVLDRPAVSDESLNEMMALCAAILDHSVSQGSGETAAWVLANLHRLCRDGDPVS